MRILAALVPFLVPLAACGGDGAVGPDPFAAGVTKVVLEVDAQAGAAPFTGATAYGDTWDLTTENLAALLGDDLALDVPQELEQMGTLDDVPEGDLDGDELLALASAHRDEPGDDETASYHVLFVDRFYEEDGERQANILGVSIGDERVIAMFKPVLGEGALAFDDGLDRFVEQSTLIHELGHALGLVDNGLPMVRDHKDEEHGPHCDDDACVMYYLNEGFSDAVQYARDALLRDDLVLFNDACLADAAAARE